MLWVCYCVQMGCLSGQGSYVVVLLLCNVELFGGHGRYFVGLLLCTVWLFN
jgi:hypothetical protein